MYVPLGGSAWSAINIWPIFAFVAVWHDINANLLTWSLLISVFFLPELFVTQILAPRLRPHFSSTHWRHLTAFAASFNIILMMVANLVGFAVGMRGGRRMFGMLWSSWIHGFVCTGVIVAIFFAAAQCMLELRAEERRNGIYRNY